MKMVFITGGTGYLGTRLIRMLLMSGYRVRALIRSGSEHKLPEGCEAVVADAFDAQSFQRLVPQGCTFVQLLGVAHPGPSKGELFRKIDLCSMQASVRAATHARVGKFVYVSVSQSPTRIMREYQAVRAEGERLLQASHLNSVILRPWYIIGPGHYWPLLLIPFFKVLEWIPGTAEKAKSLRVVYLAQMLLAMMDAIEKEQLGTRVIEINQIREM